MKIYGSTDYKALTDAERTVFRDVVKTLVERGLFLYADIPVIAGYARNVVLARVAARDVQKVGTVIEFQDRGCTKWKVNPAVDIMTRAQTAYESTAIRLGLTPTGRKRLKGEEKMATALESFMEKLKDGSQG